jgi:hypothetical protein
MTGYSDGVTLALRIARFEAQAGCAAEVGPGYLLLGLGTLCRADLGGTRDGGLDLRRRQAVEADAGRLRTCYAVAGVDAAALRRRLRRALAVAAATGHGPATGQAAATERVMAALRERLRPELLGRIGRVVVFAALDRPALRRIAGKLVDGVRDRLAGRAITLTLTDDAYDLLLRHGGGARSGARGLERAVDRLIVRPLGRALLAGRFEDGASVRGEAVGDTLIFATSGHPETVRTVIEEVP